MVEILVADDLQNRDQDANSCPFEGPEKLLELWFEPTSPTANIAQGDGRVGLRSVPRHVWEEMLDIVKCKVLNVLNGNEVDAYLLSESSFFVFPHKLILKTCGTTLNLLGLPRILAIAREHCGFTSVWRCFYSRKSFMFPERQEGPHKEWKKEVEYLDGLFDNGSAYTVGRVNGDHWLLYMTTPDEPETAPQDDSEDSRAHSDDSDSDSAGYPEPMTNSVASLAPSDASTATLTSLLANQDYTIEILMTKLSAKARRPFFFLEEDLNSPVDGMDFSEEMDQSCAAKGAFVSSNLGIQSIFPKHRTRLDSYAFEPCGYSANALINAGDDHGGEGYYTIHVTPEEGWSYASFECNVPVKIIPSPSGDVGVEGKDAMPDLETLIQRVVDIFQPGHLTLTLFVSQTAPGPDLLTAKRGIHLDAPATVEVAQHVFRQALRRRGYKRADKTNYEFGGYDLAFATFHK